MLLKIILTLILFISSLAGALGAWKKKADYLDVGLGTFIGFSFGNTVCLAIYAIWCY
jgi:hypothetical protein